MPEPMSPQQWLVALDEWRQASANPVLNQNLGDRLKVAITEPSPPPQITGLDSEIAAIWTLIRDHRIEEFAGTMTITPELAAAMLAFQKQNRNIRSGRVEMWKTALQAGRFACSNDAIVFDTNGDLRNGQHRLTAVIQTRITAKFIVMFGANPKDADTYDTGASRSAADFFRLNGRKNGAIVGSFVRMKTRIDSKGRVLFVDTSGVHRVGEEMLDKDDTLARAIAATHKAHRALHGNKSSLAMAYWKIANESRRNLSIDEFWDHLTEGHELEKQSAIFKLRAKLKNLHEHRRVAKRQQFLEQTQMSAWIIQGWNCWLKGKTAIGFQWDKVHELPTVM